MNENGNADSALSGMIQSGAGALGIAAGAAAGTVVAGPVGAVAGAAAGALLQDGMKKVAGDVATRFTAQTEQARMGSLYVLAQNQIVQRLNGGQQPRSESFFRPRERKKAKKLRSEADELLEGTFLAARKAYEERKVELLANFYTNIVFRDDIDSGHANYILSLMESLTYRQLLGILIIGTGQLANSVRARDFRGSGALDQLQIGVLFELYQLAKLDLVADSSASYILGVADINPAQLRLQGTGAQLYNLMQPAVLEFEDYGYFVNAFEPDGIVPPATAPQ
ncbi:hypothetical protein [Microbacterium oxydans]|uniref:hypothetical protein n=1 Tax=Microbacterium oxydans TaxID=82380 RepID=UPI0022B0E943|nr:hypothetical protein [Microbacterium oxydans]MCZ4300490.1 hypothetical protein [Microbacterium oxydans]